MTNLYHRIDGVPALDPIGTAEDFAPALDRFIKATYSEGTHELTSRDGTVYSYVKREGPCTCIGAYQPAIDHTIVFLDTASRVCFG